MQLNYSTFPNAGLVQGLRLYFENGIEPGSFLSAVLCNDLKEACGRADRFNRHLLFEIVYWLHNDAPAGTWGSPQAFELVLAHGGAVGAMRAMAKQNARVLEGEWAQGVLAHQETVAAEEGNVDDQA